MKAVGERIFSVVAFPRGDWRPRGGQGSEGDGGAAGNVTCKGGAQCPWEAGRSEQG